MHYNRKPLIGDLDPWDHLFINIDNDEIGSNRPHSILNIGGATMLHQHEITILTGSTHCRAHAVAKMIAAAVISGSYPYAQSVQVASDHDHGNKVLWIDSVHSFYSCCAIIDDLKNSFSVNCNNLRFMCLDDIGCFNERYEEVLGAIIKAIGDFKPSLVIIDDLDHLAVDCGYNATENFYLMMREVLDYNSISLLCVGYNLIGRAKSTAGSIGKRLFGATNNIFRVSNRGNLNIVEQIKCVTGDGNTEFAFTVNEKNFPQQVVVSHADDDVNLHLADNAAMRDLFSAAIPQGQEITPQQLVNNINKWQDTFRKFKRQRFIIASALASGIINRTAHGNYRMATANSHDTAASPDASSGFFDYYINKLKITNKIQPIPPQYKINSLTFIKNPAPPSLDNGH